MLFVQGGEGYSSCSGTMLDADTVLTAGHCTGVDGNTPNSVTWVSNHPDPLHDYDGSGIAAYLQDSDHWVEGQAIPHPEYDNFAGFPDTYDVGVVELEGAIDTGGVYGTLPDEGFLDALMTKKGRTTHRQVAVVGYGMQGTVPAFYQDDFMRYQGTSTITGLGRSANQGGQNVQLSNSPGKGNGSGGTCFGDSGGPAFWIDPTTGEETTTVVAVTSFGITGQCAGTDFSFRTDIDATLDFVSPYL
ncbi:trypsin-like serine protease [Ornithinimicrobium flavum]|uniref:trypsin-like serine protease n=1 Tax=Ornithinimicrobium flavum TaxID=1288636 RepID=UPI0010700328|nr:trypsin-like serine protease [Ornithinimicrobium flavum]